MILEKEIDIKKKVIDRMNPVAAEVENIDYSNSIEFNQVAARQHNENPKSRLSVVIENPADECQRQKSSSANLLHLSSSVHIHVQSKAALTKLAS